MKIGILGSGQLAKMLVMSANPLSFSTCVYSENKGCAEYVTALTLGAFNDVAGLQSWAADCDVITFENENIDVATLDHLKNIVPVYPSRDALAISQDRLLEKNYCREHDIPCSDYYAVDSLASLHDALERTAYPALLKTRRMGYDGKGQYLIRDERDIPDSWKSFQLMDWICEQWIDFQTEVSQIAVRDRFGNICFYPLTQNTHEKGILQLSRAPCDNVAWKVQAENHTRILLESLNYVGVMTVEFFVTRTQTLVLNEIAPRVHNSGHWTIEGAYTSQFENHVRAITDLPLGCTEALMPVAMINCVGVKPDMRAVLAIPGSHYHWYGKPSVEPDRKVGHITLLATSEAMLETRIGLMLELLRRT